MIPITEIDNANTAEIDRVTTVEAVRLINNEDKLIADAVGRVMAEIGQAIDRVVERLQNGGRLFYVGTGTSGRLGVLDASEIPPTFGVSYDLVQGVIAGGYDALHKASEASEDDGEAGARDIENRGVTEKDAVIGIAASGGTPYTIGAVEYARKLGCFTACISCVPNSALTEAVEVAIVPVVGPEAITGSTRMKSGTAQKMALNMISTVAMIRLGYVKGNRMTNVKPSNEKLKERSIRILAAEADINEALSKKLLETARGDLRIALVMKRADVGYDDARTALLSSNFVVDQAVRSLE
ncbi:MAG: N-acetylmuramic acid 6-phosphate etherase [Pyrinomonadaceae bacterium]